MSASELTPEKEAEFRRRIEHNLFFRTRPDQWRNEDIKALLDKVQALREERGVAVSYTTNMALEQAALRLDVSRLREERDAAIEERDALGGLVGQLQEERGKARFEGRDA